MLRFHQRCPLWRTQRAPFSRIIFLLLVLGYTVDALPQCYHTKMYSLLVANCQGQRHKAVPETTPSTQVLLLNFNFFSTILQSSFPLLTSLKMLSLGKQQGGSLFVGERAFQNVSNIMFLDLGGNRNLILHPAAFSGLTKLEVLLLDFNGFDEGVLERGYFQDLVSLKRLDLSGNRIRRLRPDLTFQGLRSLSILQLKFNNIGTICGEDLQNLKGHHLALLDLSSNRLLSHHACTNPFHNITLGTLDISSNSWNVKEAEQFFTRLNGLQIQNLKMQHSAAIGSGFGFHNLKGISASTFSGLNGSGIFSLDMSYGFLNELVSSAFSGFSDLNILLLRSNQITKIQDRTFIGLSQLHVLDLSNNLLGELYTEALQTLQSSPLQHLILKSNHIGIVQHDALVGLNSLQILDLQDNALLRVPKGKLPSLLHLMLGQNRIGSAWGLEHLGKNLTHLDFSSNRLSDLGELWGQLGKMPTLRFLNLSSNQLARCFSAERGPRQLRELDLSYNNLENIWKTDKCVDIFQHLERLVVLNLSSNSLQGLPKGLFQGLVSLQTLSLTANLLPMLPEEAFHSLKSLRSLSLHGNPIVTLSPSTFGSLVQLQSLDLRELSLFCDCRLYDFQRWMQDNNAIFTAAETMLTCIQTSPHFLHISLPTFLHSKCAK
ncbi:toll-like receptor 5 [Rhineura floridana]|uniref:toll-like receptor 5 n=1 Tax=Rhineura floridana TaxID=261503 RepID=UPI002AC8712E|nr:toll-like receptor 5 [Rhineura floridana]